MSSENENKKTATFKGLTGLLIFFALGVGILYATSFLVNKSGYGGQTVKVVVATPPTCPDDFASYGELATSSQSLDLVTDLSTYASGGQFINSKTVAVTRTGSDEIACGYLYIRARIDGRALNEKYDSVYLSPQGLGGHILASKSITIPNPIPNKTEILLPLDSVSYLPLLPYNPNAQNYQLANWVYLLNAANKINFVVGLSATEQQGVIDDVKIVYKCWNPSTGEESKNCQLSLQ